MSKDGPVQLIVEAQELLLGALINSGSAEVVWFFANRGATQKSYWCNDHFYYIFHALFGLAKNTCHFDLDNVSNVLDGSGHLKGIGGIDYLKHICRFDETTNKKTFAVRAMVDKASGRKGLSVVPPQPEPPGAA